MIRHFIDIFIFFDLFSSLCLLRTKALNKEKRRTDTLLYQMLPRSVAERLKCNEQVDAEHYDQATIFFSDIVGFTKISSSSSPLQVDRFITLSSSKLRVVESIVCHTFYSWKLKINGLPSWLKLKMFVNIGKFIIIFLNIFGGWISCTP